MPANTTPIFELTPFNAGVTILPADTTTKKTIYTAGANGGRVDSIMVSSDDTAAVNLAFHIYDGATDYYIGNVVVAIGSGYTTVARVEAMTTLAPLLGYLTLKNGYILKANAVVTVTSAKTVTIVAMGGDY